MAGVKTFKELLVWQEPHKLTLQTYKIVSQFPKYEEFGLSGQMRRASSSIPSNIAEGFKRKTTKDSVHFYNIADCSLEELKYQLLLAKDLTYIPEAIYESVNAIAEKCGRLLNGWIRGQK